MSRERYRARSKKVQKLGRDGLVEQDRATGEEQRVSQRTADVSFGRERQSEHDALQQGKERSKKARLRAQIAEYQQPSVPADTPERAEAPSAPEVPTPEQATIERSADDVPLTRAAHDDGKTVTARHKRQIKAAARQRDAPLRLTFEQTDNTGLRFEPEKAADDNDGQAEHKARGTEKPRSRQREKSLTNAPCDDGQPRKAERGLDAPQERFVPETMRKLGIERERRKAPVPGNTKAAKQRQAAEHTPNAAKPERARLRFEDTQKESDTPSDATVTPQRRSATAAEQFTRHQRSRERPTRSEWTYNGDAVKVPAVPTPRFALFPTVEEQVEAITEAQSEEKRTIGTATQLRMDGAERIPDAVIGRALTAGGNERNSVKRIVALFQKDPSLPVSVRFLKEEFGDSGKGVTIAGQKYALWYDESGIRIAAGNRANVPGATSISWIEASGIISDLLHKGMYGMWCWNSTGIGGKTALDYLIKVRGLSFVRAVETLCGACPPPEAERPKPKPRKPFELPKAAFCPGAMVPYLQARGIDPEIIAACMDAGILYESKKYQNCVFVGKDPHGVARFACLRGTRDNFKLDVEGSDKRYNFCLASANPDCAQLAVAESPIDALSLATLVKRGGGDWRDYSYLSLGGTASRALLQYLRDHPQITQVSLCLDNDDAGAVGAQKAERAIKDAPDLSARIGLIYHNPPPKDYGKDYNEFLCAQISAERGKVKQQCR